MSADQPLISRTHTNNSTRTSNARILEYCIVNLNTITNEFPSGSVVWLPVEQDDNTKPELWLPAKLHWVVAEENQVRARLKAFYNGRSVNAAGEIVYPTRTQLNLEPEHRLQELQDKFRRTYGEKPRQNIVKITHDRAFKALSAIGDEEENHLKHDYAHQKARLVTALHRITQKFKKSAEAWGTTVERTNSAKESDRCLDEVSPFDMKTIADFEMKFKESKHRIMEEKKKQDQQIPTTSRGIQETDGEFPVMQVIRTRFGQIDKADDIDDPHQGDMHDDMRDIKQRFGKSAEKDYNRPVYEELYLLVHNVAYFAFLVIMFVCMLAFNSYELMQFFFMFLIRQQTSSTLSGSDDYNGWGEWVFFFFFFLIPYVLLFISVVGFEVSLLIRSCLQTPQMSRPRALIVGFILKKKFADKVGGKNVTMEARKELFWHALKESMQWVDNWFTIGVEFSMLCGAIGAVVHAVLTKGEDFAFHEHPYRFYFGTLGEALLATLALFILCLWVSHPNNLLLYECLGGKLDISGRMLHWQRWEFVVWCCIVPCAFFFYLINREVAYEGALVGGTMWAVTTNALYIMGDMFLSPSQRRWMTLLETSMDDRGVRPGQMRVRFYELRNKLEQQMFLRHADGLDEQVFRHNLGERTRNAMSDFIKKNGHLFVMANGLWLIAYLMTLFDPSGPEFFLVVIVTSVALWWHIGGPKAKIKGAIFVSTSLAIAGIFFWVANSVPDIYNSNVFIGVKSAYPALMLLPVMASWHKLIVRLMPSINQGSCKERCENPKAFQFNTYHALMTAYSLGTVVWFLLVILAASAATDTKGIAAMGMNVNSSLPPSDLNMFPYNSAYPRYPICKMKWGTPDLDLTVLDMAILAKYAYADNESSFEFGLEQSFSKQARGLEAVDVTHGHISHFEAIPRMAVVNFTSGQGKTIVLAIKGTSNAGEAFADASLYSGVALLGFMSQIVPIFDLVPNTLIAFLLNHLRLNPVQKLENDILNNATMMIEKLKDEYKHEPQTRFVITGHSLGGGIAGAVGAITNTEAITFSSPGSHFNRFVFNNNLERQWLNVVNVWPESDVVPNVDRVDAFTQHINCKNPTTGQKLGKGNCHLITTTICELWRVCGDSRGRQMKLCTDKVDPVPAAYTKDSWRMLIRPNIGPVTPQLPPIRKKPTILQVLVILLACAFPVIGICTCCYFSGFLTHALDTGAE